MKVQFCQCHEYLMLKVHDVLMELDDVAPLTLAERSESISRGVRVVETLTIDLYWS